ncbi:hypothetical protein ABIE48_005181 [Paenibacillus sp. OAE614]
MWVHPPNSSNGCRAAAMFFIKKLRAHSYIGSVGNRQLACIRPVCSTGPPARTAFRRAAWIRRLGRLSGKVVGALYIGLGLKVAFQRQLTNLSPASCIHYRWGLWRQVASHPCNRSFAKWSLADLTFPTVFSIITVYSFCDFSGYSLYILKDGRWNDEIRS